jgi:crossover junction endodeoxyribonuclease RusA
MKLVLPYPVSANRYWRSFAVRRKGQNHYSAIVAVSDEALAYKSLVGWTARAAGLKEPSTKPVEIGSILLVPPATRERKDPRSGVMVEVKNGVVINIDNALKVTFDALNGVAYVDDAQIKRIKGPIEYGEPQGKGGLIIEIYEFIPPPAPIFAAIEEAATWP